MNNESDVEMYVAGLVLDPSSNAPIVLLKDASGNMCLPIWIGLAEATSIASAMRKVEISRPMTHDLLKSVLDELGAKVLRVHVRDLRENTFIASIEVMSQEVIKTIDARPSDAIALAVRTGSPIMVSTIVLAHAQVAVVPIEEGQGEHSLEGNQEGPPESNFASIDKEKWEQILAEMDPEDFKYKM